MIWIENITHNVFIILVIIILVYYIYEHWSTKSELENYEDFSKELESDMDRYGIENKDQARIEEIVEKIVDKKKKEKNLKNVVGACRNGLVRGCIIGFMSGGVPGAIASGTTYGIVNGFMHGIIE